MRKMATWFLGYFLASFLGCLLVGGAGVCRADSAAARVSSDSLWLTLRQLTGDTTTPLADSTVWITTRYSPTVGYDRAARLVGERSAAWGYTVERDYFLPSTLNTLSFGGQRAWLAGPQVAAGSLTLSVSSDNGLTWASPATLPQLSIIQAASAGSDDSVVLAGLTAAGDSGAVAWSPDAGVTWSTRLSIPAVALLALTRRGHDVWCCGESGTIAHSGDGGVQWVLEPSPTSRTLYGIAAADDSTVWAVGDFGTVLRRRAGTDVWELVPLGLVDALRAITFADARHGWMVGTNGLTVRTTDGGTSWTTAGAGNAFLTCIAARDSLHVWAAGLAGVFRASIDGGVHWSVGASGTLADIYALTLRGAGGDSLWLGGRQRLAVSADDAVSWSLRNATIAGGWFNVVATRLGAQPALGSVVLCGHLDSHSETSWTRAPGADDNATGSALLLEAARVLAGPVTPRTLQIVWFGGEEDGLLGSTPRASVQRARGDSIALVIDNDEVGRGSAMTLYGNALSAADLDSVATLAAREVPSLPLTTAVDPSYRGSDQAPYWDEGFHAISFVESDWKNNSDIESTRDSLGAIDSSLVTRLTRVVAAVAAAWLSPATTDARDGVPHASAPPVAIRWLRFAHGQWRFAVETDRATRLLLSVFRVTGERAGASVSEWLRPGTHALTMALPHPGRTLASGVYFWSLAAEDSHNSARRIASGRTVILR